MACRQFHTSVGPEGVHGSRVRTTLKSAGMQAIPCICGHLGGACSLVLCGAAHAASRRAHPSELHQLAGDSTHLWAPRRCCPCMPQQGCACNAGSQWHAGDSTHLWAPRGCMEVVCEDEEWAQGWMGAEAADAASQVEAALDAPSAWLPAEQAWDPAPSTSAATFDGSKWVVESCHELKASAMTWLCLSTKNISVSVLRKFLKKWIHLHTVH